MRSPRSGSLTRVSIAAAPGVPPPALLRVRPSALHARRPRSTGLHNHSAAVRHHHGNFRHQVPGPHGELTVRARDAVVVAQGVAGVLGAEQAALAQDRDNFLDERLQPGRQGGRHHVEPVGRRRSRPLLHGVRYPLGRAGEGAMPAPAAEPADELADGEVVPPGQVDDELIPALGALHGRTGVHLLRERPVQGERVRRHLEHLPNPAEFAVAAEKAAAPTQPHARRFSSKLRPSPVATDQWRRYGQSLEFQPNLRQRSRPADAGSC